MGDTPFFSIIVPVYNAERYIRICINSILEQTFKDFEVIIVDDCSTDNSYKICKELYGENERVKLFRHKKNLGFPSFGRNEGIEKARGEYIWFVDNDDAILPNALEKLHKAAQLDGGVDAIHLLGRYTTPQDDDKPINLTELTLHLENRPEGFLDGDVERRLTQNWATNRIWLATWMGCYRRKFLNENKIRFSHQRGEDVPVAFAAMCFAKKYFMLRDSVYIWRQLEESLSHQKNLAQLRNCIFSISKCAVQISEYILRIPQIRDNRILREQCMIQSITNHFHEVIFPLYNSGQVSPELDQAVYEALLPIFGENTTLFKYFFHGFNTMWRQVNILAQQNHLLRQKDELIAKQSKLLEPMNALLAQQNLSE